MLSGSWNSHIEFLQRATVTSLSSSASQEAVKDLHVALLTSIFCLVCVFFTFVCLVIFKIFLAPLLLTDMILRISVENGGRKGQR